MRRKLPLTISALGVVGPGVHAGCGDRTCRGGAPARREVVGLPLTDARPRPSGVEHGCCGSGKKRRGGVAS
jgi:hypothetical protein